MLSKSSKRELGFVHYIAKFTISRFVILRFECTAVLQWGALPLTFKTYTSWFIVPPRSIIEASLVVKRKIYNKVYFYFGHNNAAMTIKQKKSWHRVRERKKSLNMLNSWNCLSIELWLKISFFSGSSFWITKLGIWNTFLYTSLLQFRKHPMHSLKMRGLT